MTEPRWRLVIGSDDAGLSYKEQIKADLLADPRVESVHDLGVHPDDTAAPYSEIGLAAGERIAAGDADRGVLICGTGIGMAISANKVAGIRATTAHDAFSAERSVLSNNCQVLTMGERVVGIELARRLVREWLGYVFDERSASAQKVAVITEYESNHA
ncbi:MAG TPA: ribose-5-phosphate isomerase [Mycobacteriales bacterium]|jgi:ribose 5-phosphate isomerase B|nr:ribose-5-phosphate isomerase [Mycobacteriales bacterium]